MHQVLRQTSGEGEGGGGGGGEGGGGGGGGGGGEQREEGAWLCTSTLDLCAVQQ